MHQRASYRRNERGLRKRGEENERACIPHEVSNRHEIFAKVVIFQKLLNLTQPKLNILEASVKLCLSTSLSQGIWFVIAPPHELWPVLIEFCKASLNEEVKYMWIRDL